MVVELLRLLARLLQLQRLLLEVLPDAARVTAGRCPKRLLAVLRAESAGAPDGEGAFHARGQARRFGAGRMDSQLRLPDGF